MTILVAAGICYLALRILALWAAYHAAKKHNTAAFESQRAQGKDIWRAVFMSLIVPGVGHLYLGRWFAGVAIAGLFAALPVTGWGRLICLALWVFAPLHVYFASSWRRPGPRHAWVLLAVMAVLGPLLNLTVTLWVLQSHIVEVYRISADGMAPTARGGTYVATNKLAYRSHEPAVGDIIVYTPPDHPLATDRTVVCQRVVATGGQTVQVRNGLVWIDGQYGEPTQEINRFTSSYPDPSKQSDYFAHGVTEPYLVPKGCYFVLGDNRANSLDSRCYGAIARQAITGKVVRVIWPLNSRPLYGRASP
jgi:signal peptidase I